MTSLYLSELTTETSSTVNRESLEIELVPTIEYTDEMIEAKRAFLMVSAMWTAKSALSLFRYGSAAEFDDGDVMGTNFWLIANKTRDWTMLVCGSFMFTTSLLDVLGSDGGDNLIAWSTFEWILDATLPFVYAMLFYTYDRTFEIANDASASSAD